VPDPVNASRAQRGQHLASLSMVAGSYAVDTLLLAAFAAAGTLGWQVPLAYAAIALALLAGFALVFVRRWNLRFRDHYLTLPQLVASTLVLGWVVWWVPQIGVLAITVGFIIAAFGSLRLDARGAWTAGLLLVAVVLLGTLGAGAQLGLPVATPTERVISAVWLASVLGRCMLVGRYGARMRELVAHGRAALADANKQLEDLAARDELTGARNRRAIVGHIERALGAGESFAVALLDLDHFKQVNDRHGHLVGDATLRRFTLVVGEQLRQADRLGRYGGEEFVVFLSGVASDDTALRLAERLRQRIEQDDWGRVAAGLTQTASIGVALARPGDALTDLLARADTALYQAKAEGRNRCVLG
jgi:diguanylate cyclase (GGDEF)-like protein